MLYPGDIAPMRERFAIRLSDNFGDDLHMRLYEYMTYDAILITAIHRRSEFHPRNKCQLMRVRIARLENPNRELDRRSDERIKLLFTARGNFADRYVTPMSFTDQKFRLRLIWIGTNYCQRSHAGYVIKCAFSLHYEFHECRMDFVLAKGRL